MNRALLIIIPLLATPALLAGCGGSGTNSGASSQSGGGASAGSAPTSSGGAYGAYGPASSSSSSGSGSSGSTGATEITTKHSRLGMILAAGRKQLTVYLFERDTGATSSCTGACASVWPPVTTSASAMTSGQAVSADVGTITRADGSKQVTYKGHPLYYFTRDKNAGDAFGEGITSFGAGWFVLTPNGRKVGNF